MLHFDENNTPDDGDDAVDNEQDDAGDENDTPTEESAQAASPKPPATVVIPAQTIARIRKEEREKGKRLTLKELDAKAKAKGFASWEVLLEKAEATRADADDEDDDAPSTPAPRQATPTRNVDRRELAKIRRENEQLLEERRKQNNKLAQSEKRIRELERETRSIETRFTLAAEARSAGVTDPDYAVELFQRAVKTKGPDELKDFTAAKFFGDLKKSRPHLFAPVEVPADTSHKGETAPKPADAPKPTATVVDVKKMTKEEYAAYLTKRGISYPGIH